MGHLVVRKELGEHTLVALGVWVDGQEIRRKTCGVSVGYHDDYTLAGDICWDQLSKVLDERVRMRLLDGFRLLYYLKCLLDN
jgi:hypothetical protein